MKTSEKPIMESGNSEALRNELKAVKDERIIEGELSDDDVEAVAGGLPIASVISGESNWVAIP